VLCCAYVQDTTSDSDRGPGSVGGSLLRSSSELCLLEPGEAVALADSSTVSADSDPPPTLLPTPAPVSLSQFPSSGHIVSQTTAHNKLLMQLLGGSAGSVAVGRSSSDVDGVTHGVPSCPAPLMSTPSGQWASESLTTQTNQSAIAMRSAESDQSCSGITFAAQTSQSGGDTVHWPASTTVLSGIGVAESLNSLPLSHSCSRSDVEDQLLMVQLEQAIMNAELSLEDLEGLLAVSSTSDSAALTASPATATPAVCATAIGNFLVTSFVY